MNDPNPKVSAQSFQQKHGLVIPAILFLVALAVRLTVFSMTSEAGGDGPMRSALAWSWHHHPTLVPHWGWLPIPFYLCGLVEYIFPDPVNVPRLINVILGGLTVPVVYLLCSELYGVTAAVFAATLTCFLPLHAVISTTGLADVGFCLCMLAASLFIILRSNRADLSSPRKYTYHALAIVLLILAELTRFEAWVLALVYPALLLCSKADRMRGLVTAIGLLIVPVVWLTGNYLTQGTIAITALLSRKIITHGTGVLPSVELLCQYMQSNFGLPLLLIVMGGIIFRAIAARKEVPTRAEIFYIALNIVFWLGCFIEVLRRGPMLVDRFLLLGMIGCTVWGGVGLAKVLSSTRVSPKVLVPALILMIPLYLFDVNKHYHPGSNFYTTEVQPTKIIAVARYLKDNHLDREPLITTQLDSRYCGTLLPLYLPSFDWSRFLLLSDWVTDDKVMNFLHEEKPHTLLIASGEVQGLNRRFLPPKHERKSEERFERLSGIELSADRILFQTGNYRLYDITQRH